MTSRRQFIQIVPVAGATLLGARAVTAQAALVDEKSERAVSLGYVHDAAKADKAKFKNWAAGHLCNNCAMYQGKAADPQAACTLFPGKVVAGKGWCSAWAKKA